MEALCTANPLKLSKANPSSFQKRLKYRSRGQLCSDQGFVRRASCTRCSTSDLNSSKSRSLPSPAADSSGQQWLKGGEGTSMSESKTQGKGRWISLVSKKREPSVSSVGKVGVYGRQGNAHVASFGLKAFEENEPTKDDLPKKISSMLPFTVVLAAILALTQPSAFTWFDKKYYAPALGAIMLSIGVQLSVTDFLLVIKRPLSVLVGMIAQYALKPLLAVVVITLFGVPKEFAPGFLLTAAVSGAQLASYGSYLAGADVALSIVLTSLSTIASVFMTPLLSKLLIGSVVPVDLVAMSKSILQVVIFPVFFGLFLNTYFRPMVDRIRPVLPVVALVFTSLCIGGPLSINRSMIVCTSGVLLIVPVIVFHLSAFAGGYWLSVVGPWKQEEKTARTLSLCTGMQSSTLAMLLASQFLGASNSVPPAISVVTMSVLGLGIGSFWGKGGRIRQTVRKLVHSLRLPIGPSGFEHLA